MGDQNSEMYQHRLHTAILKKQAELREEVNRLTPEQRLAEIDARCAALEALGQYNEDEIENNFKQKMLNLDEEIDEFFRMALDESK